MKLIIFLDTGTETINVFDTVEILLKGEKKTFVTKIMGMFRSVHEPFNICLNLENRAFYDSLDTTNISWIKKVEEKQNDK